MKITKEHFGKKMRLTDWDADWWFIPLGFNSKKNLIIGECKSGGSDHWEVFGEWELYEKTKKKVIKRMAPALCFFKNKYNYTIKFWITSQLFESETEALASCDEFYKFPASESMWVEIEVEEE